MNGVSVPLFCDLIKHLVKRGGDKAVPSEMMNRWVQVLGDIEREYQALPRLEKPKRKRGRKQTVTTE